MAMKLISDGRVFSSADRTFRQQDVLIDGDRVVKVRDRIELDIGMEVVDAAGLLVSAGLRFHDCDYKRLLNVASTRETIEKNHELIVGVKVRAYTNLPSMRAMERARELADLVDLPIMVHTAPAPPLFENVVSFLRPGDIIMHPYHSGSMTTFDNTGIVGAEN